MDLKKIQQLAGEPIGKKELIKQFHNTNDIINAVLEQHQLNKKSAGKIAKNFNFDNEFILCRKLWEFTHYNLNYKAEPNTQTVKSISKILVDATNKNGNDCKHFSGFIASILNELGINCFYRFAAYSGKIPTHVYVVAVLQGKEIILDAVTPYFDAETSYTYKIDINPNKKKMPLYRVSGVSPNVINGRDSKFSHSTKTVLLAPGRLALLELVKYNVLNLAVKINNAIIKDRAKVEDFWYNVGGTDFDKLLNNSIEGKVKNRILGNMDNNTISLSPDYRIGFEPATATAAIASATPIIIELVKLLKILKIETADIKANYNAGNGGGLDPGNGSNNGGFDFSGSGNNNILLIGGIGLAAFLIFRK